ncbi:cobalt-precorrin-5B (C(1))-methyltransferase CbiD [Herbaspirillum sp. RTI4]|uniref:cobalt-precorrin-5B (C(1))-methyltransferase CbiD n=1 Tax=Herbaspirillum sp. RTI4 TaxID=3048640 RepID=UPI002AB47557|nr:cobalt-precorrin-5B (C(1))-methyltransferase CbiD [Herbaspirillum sp. RTI4]MDY7579545.1 cobalt-precorrin-5B (C(1))-methyltransferase CbiD [Herbaspirillum sp. RTI4]MEA9981826.1 cobalt-precorrin-5B (C(1))-methyltransferase CbiD [Herbaspirillum sp. RTI4]
MDAAPEPMRAEFDLRVLALNGLRRGRTTGSCATAAVSAALHLMLRNETVTEAEVMLPDQQHYLVVPIQHVRWQDAQTVRAEVLKDGGDDPDSTHGATIFAEVRRNTLGMLRFFAAQGVGTATRPGLRVAVGEPAINPVPRRMMRQAVAALAGDAQGFDLAIGCEGGEAIARKTFNPRLGIVGGISILGTSGIVEPMSMASWIASIEVYVRVALADGGDGAADSAQNSAQNSAADSAADSGAECVAYLPGKIGRDFARDVLGLPERRAVQIANFLGDALDFTQTALAERQRRLPQLWLAGHPGKLAKVLDDVWDTHSSRSDMAMGAVARVAAGRGHSAALVDALVAANTVEAAVELLKNEADGPALWSDIEHRIAQRVHQRVPAVDCVRVRLFDMAGNVLGLERAGESVA